MPSFCQCGCGRRVSRKGMLTKLRSRKGYTSIAVKGMTKEQLRRLTDPDGLQEKYMTTPREMRLTDSTVRIYDREDINFSQTQPCSSRPRLFSVASCTSMQPVSKQACNASTRKGKIENSERNACGEFQVQVALGCTRSGMRTRRSAGRR